jgi:hypothetical protein
MSIIQNAVKITEDGKDFYLISTSRHDYARYDFKDGTFYACDGGVTYLRRAYSTSKDNPFNKIVNFNLSNESTFDEICEKLLWGTYGKNDKDTLKYFPLSTFTKAHLQAILKTQPHIKGSLTEKVIKRLIKQNNFKN